MKKIKIFVLALFMLILTTACSLGNTPTKAVEKLFAGYNNNNEEILVELDDYINTSGLSKEQNNKYKEIYLKQFRDLKYEIKEEVIDGDNATVTVQITVYDYFKAENDANDYLSENANDFMTDGEYDESKFTDYKLKQLDKVNDTVEYTIDFTLTKVENEWVVNELTNEQLEKIHGVYEY